MGSGRKRKQLGIILALMLALPLMNGCIWLIAGGIGAVGGYAISPDTVEGISQVTYDKIWDASVEIASIMGIIVTQDYKLGSIEANISGSRVVIDLAQTASQEVRLRVKARKNMLPNLKVAQDVFMKIKNRIAQ